MLMCFLSTTDTESLLHYLETTLMIDHKDSENEIGDINCRKITIHSDCMCKVPNIFFMFNSNRFSSLTLSNQILIHSCSLFTLLT